jgi:hypothetical protein
MAFAGNLELASQATDGFAHSAFGERLSGSLTAVHPTAFLFQQGDETSISYAALVP